MCYFDCLQPAVDIMAALVIVVHTFDLFYFYFFRILKAVFCLYFPFLILIIFFTSILICLLKVLGYVFILKNYKYLRKHILFLSWFLCT